MQEVFASRTLALLAKLNSQCCIGISKGHYSTLLTYGSRHGNNIQ